MNKYDLIVVGSGAGLMVIEEAVKQGLKCALVEKGKIGGTCLTKGCIPSKMLVYPADLVRDIENSHRIGVKATKPSIDWELISKRVWEQIDFNKVIEENLKEFSNLTVYRGSGRFLSNDSLVIEYQNGKPDDKIQSEKIVIATGARAFIPDIPYLEETGYITYDSFFGDKYPKKLWKSLVIIGAGVIGAEFAHIFSSFGTKVTIINRGNRIVKSEEEEISEYVHTQFEQNGIEVINESNVVCVKKSKNSNLKEVTIQNQKTGKKRIIESEEILLATGIQSNSDKLDVKKAGINIDEKGWIVTNEFLETSQNNIWAIGDINGKYQFRHKANHEAQILTNNFFNQENIKKMNYDSVPWAIFTRPQIGHVGMTETQVKEKGLKYKTGKYYYSDVVAGRAMGYIKGSKDDGFVKIIIGESKKILGIHVAGPQASILVQPFVYLMNSGYKCEKGKTNVFSETEIDGLRVMCPPIGTYMPIHDSMVIHPSLSELTAWVLEKIEQS